VQRRWGIHVLGVPDLRRGDDAPLPLERKAAALLAYVAIEGPTPRATLAGLLWPNVVDARARNSLRQLLHRLRAHEGLLAAGADVGLGEACADVAELHRQQEAGDTGRIADAWGTEAPELLRGQAIDDCPDLAEWLEAERARIRDAVTRAVEAEAERHEAAGDNARALVQAQRLLDLDPLSEAAYRRAMRLHYLAGDRPRALAVYHRCRQVLGDTFGVEPLPDTVELARAIDVGTVEPPEADRSPDLPVQLRRPPRLVGREEAWARLEAAWGRVQTIVVVGEPGIGKTRFLHDFLRHKGPFLMSGGLPGERNVPYAAVARRLGAILTDRPDLAAEAWVRAELSRIIPDLYEPPEGQTPIGGEPHKLRLFEAAATVLRRSLEGKVGLLNDDLHLWDDASFELGTYFISRFADSHAHSLSTVRTGELPAARWREIEAAVEAGLAEIIELRPLDIDELETLMREAGAEATAPAGEVMELSAGNPFYALEFLRSRWQSRATGGAGPAADGRSAGATKVMDARLRHISGSAQDLLRVRAFSGTAFSPELAAAVLEVPPAQVRSALEELRRLRMLGSGDEAHELVYEAVIRRTPGEARRLWHSRVARQLVAFGAGPATVAGQFLAAWEPVAAYAYLLRAAAAARAVYALDEARSWLLRALWAAADDRRRAEALLGLDDVAGHGGPIEQADAVLAELDATAGRLQDPALLIEAGLRRAKLLIRRGDHDGAYRLASESFDEAVRQGDHGRAERARLTLGDMAYFAGRYDEARSHYLAATEATDDARRLRANQRLGALEGMRGDVATAIEHHRQALALARTLNDLPLVASLLNSVGADSERLGRYGEASRHFHLAADVASRVGDRRTAAIALSNAALTQVGGGELAAALETAERGLEAARPLGADRSVAMAQFVRGYALRRLGRPEESRSALVEAVRVREAVSDVRGALVARFNMAAMDLEDAAAEAPGADAAAARVDGARRAAAVVAELEPLGIPQFLAWCLLELAFLDQDAEAVRARLERAQTLDRGEHLAFAAAVAALRAELLAGDATAIQRARERLASRMNGRVYLETSLAHFLLARSARRPGDREAQLALARQRIEREVGHLGEDGVAGRTAYLRLRLPPAAPAPADEGP